MRGKEVGLAADTTAGRSIVHKKGYDLSVSGAANFTRRNLADSIRSSKQYSVNSLMGGCDSCDGPDLYYMDYLCSEAEVTCSANGYGSYIVLGVLDRYYKPDLTKGRAIEIQMCANKIKTRFLIDLACFKVKVMNSEGVKDAKDIHAKRLLDN
jgi:20S proteasome subunit beta 4